MATNFVGRIQTQSTQLGSHSLRRRTTRSATAALDVSKLNNRFGGRRRTNELTSIRELTVG